MSTIIGKFSVEMPILRQTLFDFIGLIY